MAEPQQAGTLEDLGRAIKQKHPGQYDDVSDSDVGAAIQKKHPEAYKDFSGGKPAQPPEPPRFGPGPIQPAPSFPQGHLTGKEVGGMAVSAIPMVGGAVGGAFGGIPGAAAGGAAGEAARQAIVYKVGPENLSGPTIKTEGSPESFSDSATGILTEGATQAGFEIGGRVLSSLVGGPLHASGIKAENTVIKELSKKYNLDLTAGQVSGKFIPKIIEKLGDYGLVSRGYIQRRMIRTAENGLTAINQVLDRLHPATSPAQTGQSVHGMLRLSKDLFSSEASKLYWALDQESQGVMVDMSSVKLWAKTRLAEDAAEKALHPHGGYGTKTIALLEDAANQPTSIPFKNAHSWRSNLIRITPQQDQLIASETPGIAKQLVRDTTGAMDSSAKSLNPKAHQLWVEARQFYKDGAGLFDHEAITGLMKKDAAEVVNAVRPKIGDTETAARIRSAILDYPLKYGDPADVQEAKFTWRQFQEQFVRSRLLEDPEHTGLGQGGAKLTVHDLGAMKGKIQEFGPGVMGEIFGHDAEGKAALKNITDLAEAFSRIDKLPDQTRMILYRTIEAGGVFVFGGALNHPVSSIETLAGLEAVPMLVSGLVHSPKATAYMLDGLRGFTEATLKIKPTSLAGKGSIKVTGAFNAPGKAFAKASADIARAAELVREEREQMQQEAKDLKQDKAKSSTGPPSGPPSKLDLFKDWQ